MLQLSRRHQPPSVLQSSVHLCRQCTAGSTDPAVNTLEAPEDPCCWPWLLNSFALTVVGIFSLFRVFSCLARGWMGNDPRRPSSSASSSASSVAPCPGSGPGALPGMRTLLPLAAVLAALLALSSCLTGKSCSGPQHCRTALSVLGDPCSHDI